MVVVVVVDSCCCINSNMMTSGKCTHSTRFLRLFMDTYTKLIFRPPALRLANGIILVTDKEAIMKDWSENFGRPFSDQLKENSDNLRSLAETKKSIVQLKFANHQVSIASQQKYTSMAELQYSTDFMICSPRAGSRKCYRKT